MFNSDQHQFRRRNLKKSDNSTDFDFNSNQQTVSLLQDYSQPNFISSASFERTGSDSALVNKFNRATTASSSPQNSVWRQERETLAQSILAAEFDEMPCRDRTAEFQSCCKSQQLKVTGNGLNGFPPTSKPVNKMVADTVQFNQHAKQIGQDLSRTCAKLEQLSTLAKKKSLFDDRGPEIGRLTVSIKEDISLLNKKIAQLQEFAHHRMDSTSAKHHAQTHSRTVVVSLQSKLASVSNDFKQVLEVRTENLKQQKSRRDKFSQAQPVPSSLPPSASTGLLGSVLLTDEAKHSNGDVAISMDSVSTDSRYSQQLQLIEEQDSYIESRANAMANIESTIVELGTIFQQLAHMVQEQGEMVSRIDSNVEHTSLNIEAAHLELLKYFRGISQNRWLAIKVFGVLLVFFVIFIVFMT